MKTSAALLFFALLAGCLRLQAETKPAAINGIANYSNGLEIAKQKNKPALLYFRASWCPRCKKTDEKVLTNRAVVKMIAENFIPVVIDVDAKKNEQLLKNTTSTARQRLQAWTWGIWCSLRAAGKPGTVSRGTGAPRIPSSFLRRLQSTLRSG